jgi:hypothetical protein
MMRKWVGFDGNTVSIGTRAYCSGSSDSLTRVVPSIKIPTFVGVGHLFSMAANSWCGHRDRKVRDDHASDEAVVAQIPA